MGLKRMSAHAAGLVLVFAGAAAAMSGYKDIRAASNNRRVQVELNDQLLTVGGLVAVTTGVFMNFGAYSSLRRSRKKEVAILNSRIAGLRQEVESYQLRQGDVIEQGSTSAPKGLSGPESSDKKRRQRGRGGPGLANS